MLEIIRAIELEQIRTDLPEFSVGDTVKVHIKISEGNKERIQVFEGTVLKRQHGGLRETFTVRRVASGVGVEKTFPVNAPVIEKIEIVRLGKVRRAKLFYLRDRVGKAAKVKERMRK
ncbi:50S ribosomal protein L19 [Clostridium sp. CM028]|uniref:50S ribosomal protein L19 n=1 Tax=Clostridium TaxID=1485 RepID=UPI0013EEE84F|nr:MULTISPECIES: 50S ribosomal protein L19 [Clostridium]MBU3091630.1 50S ribosomal protein L19 [Clostridium sp. CF011]MBW9144105.1 50S ribosomal protein L19 [Clostridium sp. CM027]MBW9147584.1 50S ribosomal protein L19 [Clostridium sp. CM028]MBZ9608314.1 50S ribosomal protein L19 [Clostridium estertheticum]UVE41250.1 50S ribosomal protein L19 [Clostridium sp. CM027]